MQYSTTLLFYDSRSGIAEFYGVDDYGNLNQLSSTTYSTGWTHIIPIPVLGGPGTTLLFYNSNSGPAQFYSTDGQGGINQLTSTTYSTGWTHIIPGDFAADFSPRALLFYNGNSGLGQFYNTDFKGGMHQLSSATYSTGWTHIVDVPADQGPDLVDDDLLFYNGNSGVAQFYRSDRQGHINQLSSTTYSTGWTLIEWL